MNHSAVRQQYERFPYPPVSALALPRPDQGRGLQYERAVELAEENALREISPASHHGCRILVAGCGTLEALVVAQSHPRAAEIVALDLSRRSLATLQRRIHWARLRDTLTLSALRGRRLPPMRLIEADIRAWRDDFGFDYVLANNMLHHTDDPAATLQHLAGLLKPGGVMRVVTYPAMSRFWIRQTGDWLKWHGLTPEAENLQYRAVEAIEELPQTHPLRSCFSAHRETDSITGLVDAFFHACETPLTPLQWQQASEMAGLEWLGETQSRYARGQFLCDLLPAAKALSSWQQLQVLDDVLELTSNPVWWFCKRDVNDNATAKSPQPSLIKSPHPPFSKGGRRGDLPTDEWVTGEKVSALAAQLHKQWYLPSQVYWQLGQGLRRADEMLLQAGTSVEVLVEILRREVGPRIAREGGELPGLTISEYPINDLLQAQQPLTEEHWRQLQTTLGATARFKFINDSVPGENMGQQAQWLQLYYGVSRAQIGPLTLEYAGEARQN